MKRPLRAAWRLTEAALLPELLRQIKGAPASDRDHPEKLADLLVHLRRDPDFPALGRILLLPNRSARRARFAALWPRLVARLSGQGRHHLGLLALRWGWTAHERGEFSVARRRWVGAMRHFGAALAEPQFMNALAQDCAVPLEGVEPAHLAVDWLLEPHGQAILAGIDEKGVHHPEALAPHWQVIAESPELLGNNDPENPLHAVAQRAAQTWRRRLDARIDDVLADQARPIEPTHAEVSDLVRPFETLRHYVKIVGMSEDQAVWGLEKAVEWSWPLYKTKDEARLKPLLDASKPFADHVSGMILADTGAFGRNGLCADYILFVADFAPNETQELFFKRALKVCPGHRNSRLQLSFHKLNAARVEMVKGEAFNPLAGLVSNKEAVAAARRAKALLDEAEELFPPNERIPEYRERLQKLAEQLEMDDL